MTQTPPAPPTPRITPWRIVVLLSVGLSVLAAFVMLCFTWTTVQAEAKDLPVAVVGTEQEAATLSRTLPAGTFDLQRFDTLESARGEIDNRSVYGAIVLGQKPEVIVASAASNPVRDMLTRLAPTMQAALPAGQQVAITDAAPWSPNDPSGAGFALAGFPIVLTGFIGGVILSFVVHGRVRRLVAGLVYATLVACTGTFVLQGVLGILQGNVGLNLLIIGFAAASGTLLILGLNSLLGRPGIPLGVIFLVLLANPLSGFGMPVEFYPEPWGQIGTWLAPGNVQALLRDNSYFPMADLTRSWLIIAGWTALGAAMIVARRERPQPARELAAAQ